jgi:hypothetical protein
MDALTRSHDVPLVVMVSLVAAMAAGGQPSLWRIRYFDIRPERFSWTAGRSTDGGATWTTSFQQLEARRIGPPRSLEPLTSVRK